MKPRQRFGKAPKRHEARPAPTRPLAKRPPCPAGKAVDRVLEQGLRLTPWVPSLPVVAESLGEQRRLAVQDLVAKLAPAVAALTPGIRAGDAGAICHYDTLMDAAVQALRHHKDNSLRDILVDLDNQTYHPGYELSDDPKTPMQKRLRVLDTLHRFNMATYSYDRWGNKLLGWIADREPGGAPLSVVDLAAGTGGFAVALKQRFKSDIKVTATDLVPEFLQLGTAEAQRTQTDVAFAQQDALDLSAMRDKDVDVFTCTQSLHHFTPGQLGRMMGEACRAARRGLCFIDGERGVLVTSLVTASMAAYSRDYLTVHDTAVSLRRMYVAEEMLLLARLAPGLDARHTVEAGRISPGHLYVRIAKDCANGKRP